MPCHFVSTCLHTGLAAMAFLNQKHCRRFLGGLAILDRFLRHFAVPVITTIFES